MGSHRELGKLLDSIRFGGFTSSIHKLTGPVHCIEARKRSTFQTA